jgi:flagellar hook-length control protein FliK
MSTIDQQHLLGQSQPISSSLTKAKKPPQNIDLSVDSAFQNMLTNRMGQSDIHTPQANTEQVSDHQSERQSDQGRSATQQANHLANGVSETSSISETNGVSETNDISETSNASETSSASETQATHAQAAKNGAKGQSEPGNQTSAHPVYREVTDHYASRSALGSSARALAQDTSLTDGLVAGQATSSGPQEDGTSILDGLRSAATLGAGVLTGTALGQGAAAITGIAGKLSDVAQSIGSVVAVVMGAEKPFAHGALQMPILAETKATFASPHLMSLSAQPATNIQSALGSAQWTQEISQQVIWLSGGAGQSASLTLNPPELGPMQVVIHIHNNTANATFISDSLDVRQALTEGLPFLREMMSQSGIELGQANVSSGDAQRNLSQDAMGKENKGVVAGVTRPEPEALEDILHTTLSRHLMTSKGRIDTFA